MSMSEAAEQMEISVSTVSRTVKNKYLQCCYGIFPLAFFFSKGISAASGNTVTPADVKSQLQAVILAENKKRPLSDLKISEKLSSLGYPISRRTVAKYRGELGILDAEGRREF